jgi:hypothetical protein
MSIDQELEFSHQIEDNISRERKDGFQGGRWDKAVGTTSAAW